MIAVNIYTGCILSNIGQGIFRNYEMVETENIPTLDDDLSKFLKIIKSNCAKYSLIPKSHEFLKLDNYCHFTSPLRRYSDTLNHLLWKSFKYGLNISVLKINTELIDEMKLNEALLNSNYIKITPALLSNLKDFSSYISVIISTSQLFFLSRVNHYRDSEQPEYIQKFVKYLGLVQGASSGILIIFYAITKFELVTKAKWRTFVDSNKKLAIEN